MIYRVEIEPEAEEDLDAISDQRTVAAIGRALLRLEDYPRERGKPLKGSLSGFYSIRCGGQRYRAVYAIDEEARVVSILVIGIRREGDKHDAYEIAENRLI